MTGGLRFGVDLGGTKIELVAMDGPAEVWRERVPTPADDYDAILEAVAGLDRAAQKALGRGGSLGIGTPGSVSPKTGLLRNSNTTVLNGRPLAADLQRMLGREVRLANDANCFALSEAFDGAAAGADVVFGVILGTGVGGGIVVGGRVLAGGNGIAGEWGHNPLPRLDDDERPGPACYCGRFGCIETFLSGPAVAAEHAAVHGGHTTAAQLASATGPAAEHTWQRYEARLARALASVVNLLDPDVIVLGGGLSNVSRLYTNVPALLHAQVFSDVCTTPIVRARHGDSSGVRGAARLWDTPLAAAADESEQAEEEEAEGT